MTKRVNPLRSLLSLSDVDGETTATQSKKSNRSYLIYLLLGVLLVVTSVATTHYFRWSMMGLITFVLAYVSKGIRNK